MRNAALDWDITQQYLVLCLVFKKPWVGSLAERKGRGSGLLALTVKLAALCKVPTNSEE